jgi:hypothetical protein
VSSPGYPGQIFGEATTKETVLIKLTAMPTIVWSDYIRYRAKLREFSLERVEEILNHSSERYFDSETHRMIAVGKHDNRLVVIPYDEEGGIILICANLSVTI